MAAAGGFHAGQPLAHQHRQRIGERRVGAVGDLVELAAMEMVIEHRGEVFRNARHAARADRLDPRLLHRLEHAARLRIARHQLAMQFGVVTGDLQRDGVGMAAHHRRIPLGHLARRLGQPRLAGREPRALSGEADVELRRLGDRLQAGRHRTLERLGWGFLVAGPEFAVGGAHVALSVAPAQAGAHNHPPSLRRENSQRRFIEGPRGMGPGFRRDDITEGSAKRHVDCRFRQLRVEAALIELGDQRTLELVALVEER